MNIKEDYNDIWYGCLHIKTRNHYDEMLGNVDGAYVNLLAKAHDRKELFAIIKEYTTDLGFVFVKLSDISPLQDRLLSTNGIS